MTSEDPPLTKEELSELEKELSERKNKPGEKLSQEELEQAIKDFSEKKKAEKKEEEDTESEVEEESFENAKTSESLFFVDKNKFIESVTSGSRLEKSDFSQRTSIADNIEQRVSSGQSSLPQLFQRPDNKRDEDREDFSYSLGNYDNSEEKKYTPENDVESHLVRSPGRPENVDMTQVGKGNILRRDFDRQADFKSPYPSYEQSSSSPERDYIQPEKTDIDNIGKEDNTFLERDSRRKSQKL